MGEAPRARITAQNTLTTWHADRLYGAMDGKSNNKGRRNDNANDEEEVKRRHYDTDNDEKDYRVNPDEEDENSDEYSEDDSDDKRSESDDNVEGDDASINSNCVNDDRDNFFEKSCPIHDGTLLAHHPHQYKECIFAFGKKNFRLDRANALAQSGKAPEFWINTYHHGAVQPVSVPS
eukprot:scaffold12784_cov92-Skeletonema_dohrnii-CCMP3373.AAC.1